MVLAWCFSGIGEGEGMAYCVDLCVVLCVADLFSIRILFKTTRRNLKQQLTLTEKR